MISLEIRRRINYGELREVFLNKRECACWEGNFNSAAREDGAPALVGGEALFVTVFI